ncbi:UDP-glucosyltransferase 2-like [Hyalella azteca]|uniref:UDP-glucosyltransferase 2-like n=1 Tax=Hyalella azteca TaxID=294128 RepID=A0A8B7NS62_HYAAZ|nr:UDP-glucosyltransferase 2-like [Hyalella azteca]
MSVFKSHYAILQPLISTLAERGHEVSVLSHVYLSQRHPNVSYYDYKYDLDDFFNMDHFRNTYETAKCVRDIANFTSHLATKLYDDPAVKNIIAKKNEFDLVISDQFAFLVTYPLMVNMTHILFTASYLTSLLSAYQGNVFNPAAVSNGVTDYPKPYSFLSRVKNILVTLGYAYIWLWSVRSPAEDAISKIFPGLPSSYEVERNASLIFFHSHLALDGAFPLLPNQIMLGGMVARDPEPLPKAWND